MRLSLGRNPYGEKKKKENIDTSDAKERRAKNKNGR